MVVGVLGWGLGLGFRFALIRREFWQQNTDYPTFEGSAWGGVLLAFWRGCEQLANRLCTGSTH